MTDLEKQISSEYIKAENLLHKRNVLQVFVEDEEDIPFWKAIFSLCNVKTTVNPASITSQKRGKEILLRYADNNQLGKSLIIAVDSDYDYLLGDTFEKTKLINNSPFIFQTYVYSIENFKSLAEIQHQIIVETTLVDNDIFDYSNYLQTYSELIYELFLYSFFCHRENLKNAENHKSAYEEQEKQLSVEELKKWQTENKVTAIFTVEEFCKIIELNKFEFANWEKNFDKIKARIDKKLESLQNMEEQELRKIKQDLEAKKVTPKTVYLFAKGHKIYDNVVGLCIKEIHKITKSKKLKEITENSKNNTEKTNQIQKYLKQNRDLETVRQTHKGYHTHFFVEEIKKDIQRFLSLKEE